MRFHVIIPARLASTRLPNKPLADIGGAPMVVRVAQRALRSGASRVVVAADDAQIAAACAAHGIDVLLTRVDHASGSDRLAEACDLLGLADEDVVVNVQGDEPFIEAELIDALALLLDAKSKPNSLHVGVGTAACAIENEAEFRNPNVVKLVRNAAGLAQYFSRAPIPWWRDGSQPNAAALPEGALRHIGAYSYRVGTLRAFTRWPMSPLERLEALEQLRLMHHSVGIAVHVCDQPPAPGVDTPEDLVKARERWNQGSQAQPRLSEPR
jgi:3-deoxy-manno-octulosonate cytidylyltransferase (CMP-KDO synthetase)